MSLNRSLVWHYHSDSEEPPSEKKSFRRCDGYLGGVTKGLVPKQEMCARQMLDYAQEMVHG